MKIKGIIFDMDGVLVDSERYSLKQFEIICGELGLVYNHDHFRSIMGTTPPMALAMTTAFYGAENTENIFKLYDIKMPQGYQNHLIPLMPGAYELINYLLDNEIPMALATSNTYTRVESSFLCRPFNRVPFEHVISAESGVKSKPDPDIFLKASAQLNEDITQCMVVEDSVNGARAAINAKSVSVLMPQLIDVPQDVYDNICYIKKDLYEVLDLIKELTADEVL